MSAVTLRKLQASLRTILERKAYPVGTVHKRADGNDYQKQPDSSWKRVPNRKPIPKKEIASKKDELVSLPPPPPYPFSSGEKLHYMNDAMNEIDNSLEFWEDNLKTPDSERADWVNPGFTYSSQKFNKERRKYAKNLTPSELEACLFYSHMGDRLLNAAHRYGTLGAEHDHYANYDDLREMNDNLIKAIHKHKLPQDTFVERKLMGEWAKVLVNTLKSGDTFVEPGFCSTSATDPFETEKGGFEVTTRIKLPKGTSAAPIPTRYDEENELLLPPGTKFKVVKSEQIQVDGGTSYSVELEVVS